MFFKGVDHNWNSKNSNRRSTGIRLNNINLNSSFFNCIYVLKQCTDFRVGLGKNELTESDEQTVQFGYMYLLC